MRILPVAVALGLSFSAAALKPKPQTEGNRLEVMKREYLDALFKAKPHLATFMGDHRFDDKVVDYSQKGLDARQKELEIEEKAVAGLDRTKLSLDEKTDAEVMGEGIALELLYLREIKDWTWDPRFYDSFPFYDPREIIGERFGFITHGDYAPEAERRKAVTAQLKALPTLVAQKKAITGAPSRVYLDQAQKDNKGTIEVLESEVKEFTKSDQAAEAARVAAVAAFNDYQKFLEKDLPPRATRDWKLGAALYRKKFPLALQTKLTPDDAIPRAEKSFKDARADLYATSRRLAGKLFPKEKLGPASNDPKEQAKLISRVKDELSKTHPAAAELVKAHAANLDRLRSFIEKHDLLALPATTSLSVVEMPPYKRGSSGAEYLAPGVLDKSKPDFHATYYVDPVDMKWPADKIENYLRANNSYEVELTAAHEAYPGHHTQFSYERKDLNPLRATLWNGAFAEGWACYGEGLITRLGYGDANNDAFKFFDARGRMIVATNILLDIKLQSGTMTDEQAVKFMVDEGFQEQTQAEKKLLRAKLDSTQLAQYWLGLDEIERLEADYRKKVGAKFTQRAFDEALIGHGSIAVEHVRTYMMGE